MRFMMLMIPGVYQGERGRQAKADFAPPAEAVERMMKYNEELARAGALISLDGLQPPSTAARISFSGGKVRVTDGPFTESKEVLGGYWMIDVKSREEAIEWAKRVPADEGDVIEVRQVAEIEDWPEDARRAAENPVVEEEVRKHRKG
ncbi:MAG: YciI family protein [Ignavibacterium sp.]|jgi:hypothetical protein